MNANHPKAWLWPDRVISKRESRRLREEHNRLVNETSALLEIELQLTALCVQLESAMRIEPMKPKLSPDNETAQGLIRELGLNELHAVAQAADDLHRANQLEMGAVEMNKRWVALENALNEWRAAE